MCGDQSKGLPDFYYEAVLADIKPPDWNKALVSIMVGGEIKLGLWTDGEKFRLWTDTLDLPQKNLNRFLLDLDQSCALPADPGEAAALLKVRWNSIDLSASQFGEIHQGLIYSLSQSVTASQQKYETTMKTRLQVVYVDATTFKVVYNSVYEHLEVQIVNDPKQKHPVLEWIRQLQKLGEDSFHPQIWAQ